MVVSRNCAYGLEHIRDKFGARGLCGVLLSLVDYERRLPPCGACNALMGLVARTKQVHPWGPARLSKAQRASIMKTELL